MESVSQSNSWERLWQEFDRRFYRDLNELKIRLELNNLQETEGIIEYHCNFEQISSRGTLPEDYLVHFFLAGLRSDTQSTVQMFQPQSIRQCFLVGKLYEGVHHLERSNGASEFKNSTSNQPNQKILYTPSNGFSGTNSTSFSVSTESPIDLERNRSTSADSAASLLAAITNIQPAATTAAMTSDHSPLVAVNQASSLQVSPLIVSLSDPSSSRHDVQQFKQELSPSNTKDESW